MRSKSKRYYDISIATYVLALLPFFVYFAIYGSLGLYPNYNVSSIDLKPLHDLELQLFGIMDGATKVIPGAYFQHHNHQSCGLCHLLCTSRSPTMVCHQSRLRG